MPRLGEKIKVKDMKKGGPPVLLQVQAEGFIKLTTPAEIRGWEEDVKKFYGVTARIADGMHACETCSGGCSDDCGMLA